MMTVSKYSSNFHSIPEHDLLSDASLNPALQLSHFGSPSIKHFAPDDPTPLGHEHWLASHLVLSPLTFQPPSQLDTSQPLLYVLAFAILHADHRNKNDVKICIITSSKYVSNFHSLPVHDLLSDASLNPALQLSHFGSPSIKHFTPDDPAPLGHEHWLASHLALSPLTFQPPSQLDTSHPLL